MILHVDMDAFYAAVEQRDDPSLRGRPVIVGGPSTVRGVVCAASYEAREFGVHSAMPTSQAARLCPDGIFLPARMDHYAEVSRKIREIFHQYTPIVEPLSLDEAFLDVTGSMRFFKTNEEGIGRQIQMQIRDELRLVASVGVAPNKFLAKIASDLDKPAGFVFVSPEQVQAFLDPLPISRIWGVGKVTAVAFDRLGVRTIEQVRKLNLEALQASLGADFGEHVWNLSRGIDHRSVVPDRAAKSISHEITLATDTDEKDVIRAWLLELADQVARRLRRAERSGQTVHLKLRYFDFRMITRSKTLLNPTNLTQEIFEAVDEMFEHRVERRDPVRLIGVGISRFPDEPKRQKLLFEEESHDRNEKADLAADAIRDRFGHAALSRGSRLLHNTKHRAQPRPEDDS